VSKNPTFLVLALGAVVGLSAVGGAARAGDEGYCRSYASSAVNQARAARDHDRCHYLVREDPARWSLDYHDHFSSCMRAYGTGDNDAEQHRRAAALNACIPDHHW